MKRLIALLSIMIPLMMMGCQGMIGLNEDVTGIAVEMAAYEAGYRLAIGYPAAIEPALKVCEGILETSEDADFKAAIDKWVNALIDDTFANDPRGKHHAKKLYSAIQFDIETPEALSPMRREYIEMLVSEFMLGITDGKLASIRSSIDWKAFEEALPAIIDRAARETDRENLG